MTAKLDLLQEQLEEAGYAVSGICFEDAIRDSIELPATFFPYDTGFVRIDWVGDVPEQAVLDAIQAVITAHDPADLSSEEVKESNCADCEARFLLSQMADKTPEEIYTMMQNAMDGWTSIADARADLREWLPLMAAIIAWGRTS